MDFDKLMERYDNLVRENALLRAESLTWKSKYEEEKFHSERLEMDVQALRDRQGANDHLSVARRVYSRNPDLGKIGMIKEVRYSMGWGLAEAKEAVERVLRENEK